VVDEFETDFDKIEEFDYQDDLDFSEQDIEEII
jgi:hypothetical protein